MPNASLEYIESTGTQYIDTGYSFLNSAFSYDIKFKINEIVNDVSILGENRYRSSLSILDSKLKLNEYDLGNADTSIHEISYNRSTGAIVFDNNNYTMTSSISDTDYAPLQLFKRGGSSSAFSKINLYYFKLYNSDRSSLLMDLIPMNNNGTFYKCLKSKRIPNWTKIFRWINFNIQIIIIFKHFLSTIEFQICRKSQTPRYRFLSRS